MDVLPGFCSLSKDGSDIDILKVFDTWFNYQVKILMSLKQYSRRPVGVGMCVVGWFIDLFFFFF